ncbi:hypothetical protein LCGC14_1822380, partial [marine sediment metagenome]
DGRLYRVDGAAMSPDGKYMWLSSARFDSSAWGASPPGLFRVDLETGTCEQIAGPPHPARANPARKYNADQLRPLVLAADPAGRLLATSESRSTVSIYDKGRKVPSRKVELDFVPTHLVALSADRSLAAGPGRIAVIDTPNSRVERYAKLKGVPTAVCAAPDGQRAFLALHRGDFILVFHAARGKFEKPVSLADLPEINPKRYRDVRTLLALNQPPRLLGLAGYIPFVIDLRTRTLRQMIGAVDPQGFRIDRKSRKAYVCSRYGCVSIVDLDTDRCVGTVRVGRRPTDIVPTGKDTAIVADAQGVFLLRVDLARGKVTGRIKLNGQPWALRMGSDGRQLGVRMSAMPRPFVVVDLQTQRVRVLGTARDLPLEWQHLATAMALRTKAHAARAGAGIRMSTGMAAYRVVHLRLTDGREIPVTLPGSYKVKGVALHPDEKHAYVACDRLGQAVLVKFRLTP